MDRMSSDGGEVGLHRVNKTPKRIKLTLKATLGASFARSTGVSLQLGSEEYITELKRQLPLIWRAKDRFFKAYHLALAQGYKGGKIYITCELFLVFFIEKAKEMDRERDAMEHMQHMEEVRRRNTIAYTENHGGRDRGTSMVEGYNKGIRYTDKCTTQIDTVSYNNATTEIHTTINSNPGVKDPKRSITTEQKSTMSQVSVIEDRMVLWVDTCVLKAACWMNQSSLKVYLDSFKIAVELLVPSCDIPIICRISTLCIAILLERFGMYVDLRLISDTRAIMKVADILSATPGGWVKHQTITEFITLIRNDQSFDTHLKRIPTTSFIVLVEYYILLLVYYRAESDREACQSVLAYVQALEQPRLTAALALGTW